MFNNIIPKENKKLRSDIKKLIISLDKLSISFKKLLNDVDIDYLPKYFKAKSSNDILIGKTIKEVLQKTHDDFAGISIDLDDLSMYEGSLIEEGKVSKKMYSGMEKLVFKLNNNSLPILEKILDDLDIEY